MPKSVPHVCPCSQCRSRKPSAERTLHRQLNLLVSRLDEAQRRWFVAVEANRLGRGGTRRLAMITGMSQHTIRRGRHEVAQAVPTGKLPDGIRLPGGGRRLAEARDPAILRTLEQLLVAETAGDPMGPAKYKRSSLRTLSAQLQAHGHVASTHTVARLLRALGYSPKANVRRTEARSTPPERDAQFRQIAATRAQFHASGDPIISVDTKKKR
jgi:hypothetical protein